MENRKVMTCGEDVPFYDYHYFVECGQTFAVMGYADTLEQAQTIAESAWRIDSPGAYNIVWGPMPANVRISTHVRGDRR